MEIDAYWIILIVVLVAMTIFLTGPGLWSEKWGWSTFDRIFAWFDRWRRPRR